MARVDGDVVAVAASVVPAEEATHLLARPGPLTAVGIPGVVSAVVRVKVK